MKQQTATTHDNHYAPEWFMKRFADGKMVHVFDKQANCPLKNKRSVSSICYKTDFTTLKGKVKRKDGTTVREDFVEEAFQRIDSKNAGFLRTFVSDIKATGNIPAGKMRSNIAYFMAQQFHRSLKTREAVTRLLKDSILPAIKEMFLLNNPDLDSTDFDIVPGHNTALALHGLSMFDKKLLLEQTARLVRMRWQFVQNATGLPFYTSDEPVCVCPKSTLWTSPFVYLPVSKHEAILLTEPDHKVFGDISIVQCKLPSLAIYFNWIVYIGASRHVIVPDGDFTLVKQWARNQSA